MRLLFVVNAPEFFLSHRLPIALEARREGFDVHVATGPGDAVQRLKAMGFAHHLIPLSRSGKHPVREVRSLWSLYRLMRRIRPDIVHLVTIKPVLYGGIAARLARVPGVVAAISGLGSVFIAQGFKARLLRGVVKGLYRFALGHGNLRVIFQNPDDRAALLEIGALRREQAVLIRGSGVALAEYPVRPEPEGVPVVAFAARLLRAKGVGEFVEAARRLKARGVEARFRVIGAPDPGNPATISDAELAAWRAEGVVELLGHRPDIPALFAEANVVTLPSYYGEGLPKVLIEAAACGRAVVTTDQPGCRDAIEPGVTGLLVPVRNPAALAEAIERLLQDSELRCAMGRAGRALAEREFAIEKVVSAHLEVYRALQNSEAEWARRHGG